MVPAATRDLRELWRRVAFSVLISNFDDHLRNHGFLHAETLLGVADAFRLSAADATEIVREVSAATSHWRRVALATDLSSREIELMEPAFEHEEAALARGI